MIFFLRVVDKNTVNRQQIENIQESSNIFLPVVVASGQFLS